VLEIDRNVKAPSHVQYGRRTTDVPLDEGLRDVEALHEEFLEYANILLGRVDPPIDSPYLQLMELATAYHARALEVEMLIHWEEQQHRVIRGHPLYKFRTGQLRSFIELSKKLADLGSRRLTQETLLSDQRYDAGDNY
jgi:hypothetical protein